MFTRAVKYREVVRSEVGDRGTSLRHPTSRQVGCSAGFTGKLIRREKGEFGEADLRHPSKLWLVCRPHDGDRHVPDGGMEDGIWPQLPASSM